MKGKILELRKTGMTYEKIGELVGCSQQYAWHIGRCIKVKRGKDVQCAYTGLKRWMENEGIGICALCSMLYGTVGGDRVKYLKRKLMKQTDWNKTEIDKLLACSGMRYEEAFADG